MRKRFSHIVGLTALIGAAALFGCDSKQENTTAPSTTTSPPGTSGAPTNTIAGGGEFNNPRKADGEVKIKVITNGNDPFWDSMGIGLEVGKKETGAAGEWNAPQQTDNVGQKNVFEQALAANVDGIAVSPIAANAFAAFNIASEARGEAPKYTDLSVRVATVILAINCNNFSSTTICLINCRNCNISSPLNTGLIASSTLLFSNW